jgi:hypothetical protein
MYVKTMSFAELQRALSAATKLAKDVAAQHPEAALLLMDAVEIGLLELLVHVCNGDRTAAEAIHLLREADVEPHEDNSYRGAMSPLRSNR